MTLGYRADIDGLRAIAVLSVLLFHAFPNALPGGYVGVDVFFVISGYLITGIILPLQQGGTFRFSDFYGRRVRRLAPALLTVLSVAFLVGWLVLLPDEYVYFSLNVVRSLLFMLNFFYAREIDYFDAAAELNPLLHLWSLAVEEQFYFFWPVFLLMVLRFFAKRLMLMVCASVVFFFAVAVLISAISPEMAFYLAPTRAWELALGAACAVAGGAARRLHGFFSGLFAFVLGASLLLLNGQLPMQPLWLLLPTLATVLIIASGPAAYLNRSVLSNKFLVLIGLISYPLYLWHWPLLALLNLTEGGAQSFGMRIAALLVSFFMAYITWRWVELPVRKLGAKKILAMMFVVWVLLMMFAALVLEKKGFPERVSGAELFDAQRLEWPMHLRVSEACKKSQGISSLSFCLEASGASSSGPYTALVGDSFSNQYFYGLSFMFARSQLELVNLGRHSCAPVRGIAEFRPDKDCSAMEQALNKLVNDSNVNVVMLASSWSGTSAYVSRSDDFRSSLEATVEEFLNAGKKVILIGSSPLHLSNPARCAARPFRFGNYESSCIVDRDIIEQRLGVEHKILTDVASKYSGVGYFRVLDVLCDQAECPIRDDRGILYRDGHLSDLGSEVVAAPLFNYYQDFVRREAISD